MLGLNMNKEDFDNILKEEEKRREKQFGLESCLNQVLWDAQVSDEYFNDAMTDIVFFMKKCIENEDYKRQLYEINLKNYKNLEE